jgi:hypothetical protein
MTRAEHYETAVKLDRAAFRYRDELRSAHPRESFLALQRKRAQTALDELRGRRHRTVTA